MKTITLRDGRELQAVWIDVFKLGDTVVYKGEKVEVDGSMVRDVLRHYRMMRAEYDYEFPILRQHKREGVQWGVHVDIRLSADGWVQVLGGFLDPALRQAYNNGMIRQWSPGFGDLEHPHTGEVLRNFLAEVSFVDRAHQWTLRPPTQTNPGVQLSQVGDLYYLEADMDEENNEEVETEEQQDEEKPEEFNLEQAFGTLMEMQQQTGAVLTELAAGQAKLLKAMGGEGGDAVELGADDEIGQLKARVQAQEQYITRMELSAMGIEGELAEGLAKLKSFDEPTFLKSVKAAKEFASTPVERVQEEIGAQGNPAPGETEITDEQIIELAAQQGMKPGDGRMPGWVGEKYGYDRAESVMDKAWAAAN